MKGNSINLILLSIFIVATSLSSFTTNNSFFRRVNSDSLVWTVEKYKDYNLNYTESDRKNIPALKTYLTNGNKHISQFFKEPFIHSFNTYVFPERSQLDKQWQQDWNDTAFHSQCWMVASGVGDRLDLLSTNAWEKDACDHNANDSAELRRLIWHEMVHVYHGQHNADHKFEKMENMDWLVEGVATFVAGQLTEKRISAVKKSIAESKQPMLLNQFWKGNLRYGWSGSLVSYIDLKFGRKNLFHLLTLSTTEQALSYLGLNEQELIEGWNKSFV